MADLEQNAKVFAFNANTTQETNDDDVFDEFDRIFQEEHKINHRIYILKMKFGNHAVETALGETRKLAYLEQPAAMHKALDVAFPS